MNPEIQKLCEMSARADRLIIGLMSGTSLDGLDIALCRISGYGFNTKLITEKFETIAYTEDIKDDIRSIFSRKQADLEKLTLLNALIGDLHAGMILDVLRRWGVDPAEVDCIASHGQTIYHAPKRLHRQTNYPNATLQIGDGDHIAVKTGIITISDFRQKHIAAGGEGAPLALYGDLILFSSSEENRLLLNIGGISNFTFLPRGNKGSICSDIGPGNTLIDAIARKYFEIPFDKDGEIASQGNVNESLLEAMLSHPFFGEGFPKTTGPELFNLDFVEEAKQLSDTGYISSADLLATVTALTARSIALGIRIALGENNFTLYVSGGGCHNRFMIRLLKEYLPEQVIKQTEELGVNTDAKEAALFAILANETICGSSLESGAGPAIMMGKISLPR